MKKIGSLFFPDIEEHFQAFSADIENYQRAGRDKAFEYVRNWRCAVDLGANVGIFARHFASRFDRVIAIDPLPENVECIRMNCPDNVEILQLAIGDRDAQLDLYTTAVTTGGAFVAGHADVEALPGFEFRDSLRRPARMVTLDSLGLEHMDLIKLDIQGSEVIALRGAAETIARCKPVVLIEEKPLGGPTGSTAHIDLATELLLSYGMTARERAGADRVYAFE